MAEYAIGSKKLLEKIETDIAFDLDELSKMAGPMGKKYADRIFEKMEMIHDHYSSKWASMSRNDQKDHDPSKK